MRKLLAEILVTLAAGFGVVVAVTGVSADEPQPTPPSTTVITYDAEENLLVTTIDGHTIEVSEPD